MKNRMFRKKVLLIMMLALILCGRSSIAFARHDAGRHEGHQRGHEEVFVGHHEYRYHDGRFYRPFFFGLFEFTIGTPPVGAVIRILPAGHRRMVHSGVTYYHYNDIYYTACPSGYVVVPAPVIAAPPVPQPVAVPAVVEQPDVPDGDLITINIPNSNGSYSSVTVKKYKDGYVGPQGEYYPGKPTVNQLRALYGK